MLIDALRRFFTAKTALLAFLFVVVFGVLARIGIGYLQARDKKAAVLELQLLGGDVLYQYRAPSGGNLGKHYKRPSPFPMEAPYVLPDDRAYWDPWIPADYFDDVCQVWPPKLHVPGGPHPTKEQMLAVIPLLTRLRMPCLLYTSDAADE